ncbi:hypothetical protein M2273_003709 [Mucilaginibacter lappiensis]
MCSLHDKIAALIMTTYYMNQFKATHDVFVFSFPLERGRVGIEGGRGMFICAMKRTHPSTPLKREIAQPSALYVIYPLGTAGFDNSG